MIQKIRHTGLKKLYEYDSAAKVNLATQRSGAYLPAWTRLRGRRIWTYPATGFAS